MWWCWEGGVRNLVSFCIGGGGSKHFLKGVGGQGYERNLSRSRNNHLTVGLLWEAAVFKGV